MLIKYDGPFEILQKLSPVSYQLRMPASYGINLVLNIAHLEKYEPSPAEFGSRPNKSLSCKDFEELPEFEVEEILAERRKKGRNGNHIIQYLMWFKDYSKEYNEWLTLNQLKNAPRIPRNWQRTKEPRRTSVPLR